ncbi:hypothetical protein ACH3XW_47310 [Acanthocheilonema viteae]
MIKQELSLNLATSFPCFSVLSHDLKCCSENESLWSSMHHNSTMSAYPHYTLPRLTKSNIEFQKKYNEKRNANKEVMIFEASL